MRKLLLLMSFMLMVLNLDAQRPQTQRRTTGQKSTTVRKSTTQQSASKTHAKPSFLIVPPSGLLSGEERLKDSLIKANSQLFKLIGYQKDSSHTVEDPHTHTVFSFIQAVQEENGIRVKAIVRPAKDVDNGWYSVRIHFRGQAIDESYSYDDPMAHNSHMYSGCVYVYDMFFRTEKTTSMIEKLTFTSYADHISKELYIQNLPVASEGKPFVYDSDGKSTEDLRQDNQTMMSVLGFGKTKNKENYDGVNIKVYANGIGRFVRLVVELTNTTDSSKRVILKRGDNNWVIASTGYPIRCVDYPKTDKDYEYSSSTFNLQPGEKRTITYEFKVYGGYDLPSLLQTVRFEESNLEKEIVFRNIPIEWHHPVTGNVKLGMSFDEIRKQGYILPPSEAGKNQYRCAVSNYEDIEFENCYLIFKDDILTSVVFFSGVIDPTGDGYKEFCNEYGLDGQYEYRDNIIKPIDSKLISKFKSRFGKCSSADLGRYTWLNSNIEYSIVEPGLFGVALKISKK